VRYLLDTNVVSEWVKPLPDAHVVRWLHEVDEDELSLSAVTMAELRYGVERLKSGRRRTELGEWLAGDLAERFAGRILAVEEKIAESWSRIMARSEAQGKRLGIVDGFLAATAEAHELVLVTRDVRAFKGFVRDIYNPWKS
jgi:predicted nucleic acid-binding protein